MLVKENAYFCYHCNNIMTTIDLDEGVTPMFLLCNNPNCKKFATSTMYNIPDWLRIKPNYPTTYTYEWYKPTSEEIEQMPEEHREHYKLGGLAKRPFKGFPIITELNYPIK